MIVTVLTSGSIRHNYLIRKLLENKITVNLVREKPLKNVLHGTKIDNKDFINYFDKVKEAELNIFGKVVFSRSELNSHQEVDFDNISSLDLSKNNEIKKSDYIVVFGTSYIKKPLIEFLINQKTINLHMGLSPYYRGAACNFWAQYDKNYEKIGGTIHFISKGLDSGDIIETITVESGVYDKFEIGMYAVKKTIDKFVDLVKNGKDFYSKKQNKQLEIRYTRKYQFLPHHAKKFLEDYSKNSKILIK